MAVFGELRRVEKEYLRTSFFPVFDTVFHSKLMSWTGFVFVALLCPLVRTSCRDNRNLVLHAYVTIS